MSDRRFYLSFLVGLILVQAAWCFAVPPFRGIDEHDHAFRASAVAHGDLSPHHQASAQGWGWFVPVDGSIVDAAQPVCFVLRYTTWDNCASQGDLGNGTVKVASAQAQSNPLFYVVVGLVGRPFHGAASLYAMRAMTALMCSALLALGALALRRWSRTRWPLVGLLAGCTPVLVYSTSIVSSNGVEMAAGVVMWSALLGLARSAGVHDRWFIRVAVVGAVPLVTLRTMGPLWCLLIVACAVVLAGASRVRGLLRLRSAWAAVCIIGLATAAAAAWIVAARSNFIAANGRLDGDLRHELPTQYALWLFQSIAAFPTRNELAPLAVYVAGLTVLAALTALGLVRANRTERLTFVMIWVLTSLVSVAATVAMYQDQGFGWQGRYALPFAVGFFLLAGYVLDRRPISIPSTVALVGVALGAVVGEAVGILHVQHTEGHRGALAHSSEWLRVPDAVSIALVVLGISLQVWASSSPRPDTPTPVLGRDGDDSSADQQLSVLTHP